MKMKNRLSLFDVAGGSTVIELDNGARAYVTRDGVARVDPESKKPMDDDTRQKIAHIIKVNKKKASKADSKLAVV